MAGPLLYRPPPKWQTWTAFGGALAIHFAAVAIAAIKPTEKIEDLSQIPEAVVEMSIETQQEPPQPTPPPEEEPPPPPPPEAKTGRSRGPNVDVLSQGCGDECSPA
jgi:hypothetical protein